VRQPLHDAQRREEPARLLPLWPKELEDLSIAGRRHIIRTLDRALRAERRRGRTGHWAYDLSRHAALLASWRLECAALRGLEKSKHLTAQKKPAEWRAFLMLIVNRRSPPAQPYFSRRIPRPIFLASCERACA
jgi:hypothetical protein